MLKSYFGRSVYYIERKYTFLNRTLVFGLVVIIRVKRLYEKCECIFFCVFLCFWGFFFSMGFERVRFV